jgi:hypothetical protein
MTAEQRASIVAAVANPPHTFPHKNYQYAVDFALVVIQQECGCTKADAEHLFSRLLGEGALAVEMQPGGELATLEGDARWGWTSPTD